MTKRPKHTARQDHNADAPPEMSEVADDSAAVDVEAEAVAREVVAANVAIDALNAELSQLKDQQLRLAADYDNFRKRTSREWGEVRARAQADLAAQLLEALDNLARVAHLDPEKTKSEDVIAGVELVERDLLKRLEAAGLEKLGSVGEAFDPNIHEAVGGVPAASPALDHTVAAVFQIGYRFGGQLLRPARVQVAMWDGDADQPEVRGTDGRPVA